MEGLKVRVGGRKVLGDMEAEVCVGYRCLSALFTPAFFKKNIDQGGNKLRYFLEISNLGYRNEKKHSIL